MNSMTHLIISATPETDVTVRIRKMYYFGVEFLPIWEECTR